MACVFPEPERPVTTTNRWERRVPFLLLDAGLATGEGFLMTAPRVRDRPNPALVLGREGGFRAAPPVPWPREPRGRGAVGFSLQLQQASRDCVLALPAYARAGSS